MTLTPLGAVTLGTILEGMFYGVYMVLFILYLVLRRRNNHRIDEPLTLAQILLFGLCTASLCLDISGPIRSSYVHGVEKKDTAKKVELGSVVTFIMIGYLAQMILVSTTYLLSVIIIHPVELYRCWIVWDKRWMIIAVPGFLALVTLGSGLAFAALTNFSLQRTDPEKFGGLIGTVGIMAYSISLGVNALTTSLIVIKILSTSRGVCPARGSNLHRPLRVAAAMLIESGLLMFAFQLVFVILFSSRPTTFNIISGPSAQIYGITPTLLNIRIVIGTSYKKTREKTASLRLARSRGAATQTTGPSMGAAGVQSQGINTKFNDASTNDGATVGAV
ncbi:hypothetical protein BD779DRAFT_1682946 [Infundibulicybe gibba]|nr:hypothetical protein BD779DRAFT_1682946 [Infundibulicybe gibba]